MKKVFFCEYYFEGVEVLFSGIILFHSLSCVSITAEEEQWNQNFILNRFGIMNDKQTPLIITGFSLVQL